jgi:GxxExxY protein
MNDITYKEESYEIIGRCFQVHNNLGPGFLEIVYKDALEYELSQAGIPYGREVLYEVKYKGIILPHKFFADFVVFGKIILEVKGMSGLVDEHVAQTLNYLRVSGNKLGILVNFGELSLKFRRIVL